MATLRLNWAFATLAAPLIVAGCRHGGDEAVDSAHECPASWLGAPVVDPSIAVPSEGARVVLHLAAVGSQVYVCGRPAEDASKPAVWSFAAPEANLVDCKGAAVGRHFLNGARGLPEWQLTDGTALVARKVASWPKSDAIPWLLLTADTAPPNDAGDAASVRTPGVQGPLVETRYVQRIGTTGGLPPTDACNDGNLSAQRKVPYTADYYFYGP